MIRPITTRFASKCAESGRRIPKGVNVLYDDVSKKVYALDTKKAKEVTESESSKNNDDFEEELTANYFRRYH